MSFNEYLRKEEKVLRYVSLISRYFNGKSLWDRTSREVPLEAECDGNLCVKAKGMHYCFSMTKPVECQYQLYRENGLQACTKTYPRGISYFEQILSNANEEIERRIIFVH